MSAKLAEATATPASTAWSRYPTLYEINTWVWLWEQSRRYGKKIDLSSVPSAEWDALAAYGFEAVWLMGVWQRSPAGIVITNQNPAQLADFRQTLPDFRLEDNVGSPYCVRRYVVDQHLGGAEGLAIARGELAKRGVKLILDFVPNHVALDHPWVLENPEYFIRGNADDLNNDPSSYLEIGGMIFARGRDPYFPAWPDVLQLNAFDPGLRHAATETVHSIAEQCDGIRSDMAMLLLNRIFAQTWGSRAGSPPATEYWPNLISATRKRHPSFLFIAEVYWDLEWELQQQGFNFCYDKKLYDRLSHSNAESIRLHLCADLAYQTKLLRFIENHDEPRAAATFAPAKHRAAAVIAATQPGMRLFQEGQFEGRTVRVPVFLGRRPSESPDHELLRFYSKLLPAINRPVFRGPQWTLCERCGWPDNQSFQNLLAWSWEQADERYLLAVNFSDHPAQALVRVPWAEPVSRHILVDTLSGATYERDGDEMHLPGLYVDLAPWGYHFLRCTRTKPK